MKCSLKGGLISILFLISLIAPSGEVEFPLLSCGRSLLETRMNFRQFRAAINRLQDLDSFPDDGDSENKLHKIVKKQMALTEFKDRGHVGRRDKRRTPTMDFDSPKQSQNSPNAQRLSDVISEDFLGKLKDLAKRQKFSSSKHTRKSDSENKEKKPELNSYLLEKHRKIPDERDRKCYYECEEKPFGLIKLRHKRCPEGQFFSYKFLKCLGPERYSKKANKRFAGSKKVETPDNPLDEPEPFNEWMDASQGTNQKVPPEFKPKKLPGLKIYHLKTKRKLGEIFNKALIKKRNAQRPPESTDESRRKSADGKDSLKNSQAHHNSPRSFLIRINKKEGKNNKEQSITENDENDGDEDEESDEEEEEEEEDDDEDDTEDEEEESEEEETKSEWKEKKPFHRENLKDLFKSTKAAVANRARFSEPSGESQFQGIPSTETKKSDKSRDLTSKNKKVLIDANIKVDSTIGNALKNMLRSKNRDKDSSNGLKREEEAIVSDRENQDQMDPELLRKYDNLMRNNPRVKRYFLANCRKREN